MKFRILSLALLMMSTFLAWSAPVQANALDVILEVHHAATDSHFDSETGFYEFDFEPGATLKDSFSLTNFTYDQDFNLEVLAVDGFFDVKQGLYFERNDPIRFHVGRWTRVPSELTLKPQRVQDIPFEIRLPDRTDLANDFYGAIMVNVVDENGQTVNQQVGIKIHISPYGDERAQPKIDVDFDPYVNRFPAMFRFSIKNTGNTFWRGEHILAKTKEKRVLQKLDTTDVGLFPGESITRTISFPRQIGYIEISSLLFTTTGDKTWINHEIYFLVTGVYYFGMVTFVMLMLFLASYLIHKRQWLTLMPILLIIGLLLPYVFRLTSPNFVRPRVFANSELEEALPPTDTDPFVVSGTGSVTFSYEGGGELLPQSTPLEEYKQYIFDDLEIANTDMIRSGETASTASGETFEFIPEIEEEEPEEEEEEIVEEEEEHEECIVPSATGSVAEPEDEELSSTGEVAGTGEVADATALAASGLVSGTGDVSGEELVSATGLVAEEEVLDTLASPCEPHDDEEEEMEEELAGPGGGGDDQPIVVEKAVEPGDIKISEILFEKDEFGQTFVTSVELVNTNLSKDIDLKNYQLRFDSWVYELDVQLLGGQHRIFEVDQDLLDKNLMIFLDYREEGQQFEALETIVYDPEGQYLQEKIIEIVPEETPPDFTIPSPETGTGSFTGEDRIDTSEDDDTEETELEEAPEEEQESSSTGAVASTGTVSSEVIEVLPESASGSVIVEEETSSTGLVAATGTVASEVIVELEAPESESEVEVELEVELEEEEEEEITYEWNLEKMQEEGVNFRFDLERNFYQSLSRVTVKEARSVSSSQEYGLKRLLKELDDEDLRTVEAPVLENEEGDTWAFFFHATPWTDNTIENTRPLAGVEIVGTRKADEGLYVTFSGAKTVDDEEDQLFYKWTFSDHQVEGESESFAGEEIEVLFKQRGVSSFELQVTDVFNTMDLVRVEYELSKTFEFSQRSILSLYEEGSRATLTGDLEEVLLDDLGSPYLSYSVSHLSFPQFTVKALDQFLVTEANYIEIYSNAPQALQAYVTVTPFTFDHGVVVPPSNIGFILNGETYKPTIVDGNAVFDISPQFANINTENKVTLEPQLTILMPGRIPPGHYNFEIFYSFL